MAAHIGYFVGKSAGALLLPLAVTRRSTLPPLAALFVRIAGGLLLPIGLLVVLAKRLWYIRILFRPLMAVLLTYQPYFLGRVSWFPVGSVPYVMWLNALTSQRRKLLLPLRARL